MTNEEYEIEVTTPLLRPGITIRCWVSKNYVTQTTNDLLDIVREINATNKKDVSYNIDISRLMSRPPRTP